MDRGGLRGTGRWPAGFLAVPALAVPVAVCGIPGHTGSGPRIAAEVAVLAIVVAVIGFESTASAGLLAMGTSVLSLNGFTEDAYGQLGWHPATDSRAAAALLLAWGFGCAARAGVAPASSAADGLVSGNGDRRSAGPVQPEGAQPDRSSLRRAATFPGGNRGEPGTDLRPQLPDAGDGLPH